MPMLTGRTWIVWWQTSQASRTNRLCETTWQLSPLLLRMYRRARLATVLLPLAGLALLVMRPALGEGEGGTVVQNVLAYASCWVLGMAHREGDLARLRAPLVLGVAAACVAGSLGWAIAHRVCVHEWTRTEPAGEPMPIDAARFRQGAADRN